VPRIYTRTGDAGDTALSDGTRVPKSDPRIDACGDVDELAAWLGIVRARLDPGDLANMVDHIQRDLLAVGATLADPGHRPSRRPDKAVLDAADVERLEGWIDALERELPPLRRFILAGGTEDAARLHLTRAVCRRAERRIVSLGPETADETTLVYVNRLSDLLFTMARAINQRAGVSEIEW
jgi:cob(I)alamin adenosyltransferase